MNFKEVARLSLENLKSFVYEAKQEGFVSTDIKTTLPDQTSVYSYRPFSDSRFPSMIYADTYNGNTIEGGQESVTVDLVLRWRNQYYGGTAEPFWSGSLQTIGEGLGLHVTLHGQVVPQVVSAFLKQALSRLPREFPVRGPREFRSSSVEFEGDSYSGEWLYTNEWDGLSLFEDPDPFLSYVGRERISLNDIEVYSHSYQGGLVRDKYFPFVLLP